MPEHAGPDLTDGPHECYPAAPADPTERVEWFKSRNDQLGPAAVVYFRLKAEKKLPGQNEPK